jgi:uncharacterized protein YjbJ (UPF0337 family)
MRSIVMNKNQAKGAVKHAVGKAQESMGKVTGSKKQQAKGLGKQAAGKMEKGVGDVKENIKDATRDH